MKHQIFAAVTLAAIAAVGLPSTASALTVTVVDSSTQGAGNQAHLFAGSFGANLNGATWSGDTDGIITPPPGSVTSANKSPWANTPVSESPARSYFSVGPKEGSVDSPGTLSFASDQTSFEMLWGSIDSYNKIEFFAGATSQGSLTGAELVGNTKGNVTGTFVGCGSAASFECVARLVFSGVTFNSIEFSSNATATGTGPDIAAFEFATVPLPAAAWLLLGVSGALIAGKRRAARRAA